MGALVHWGALGESAKRPLLSRDEKRLSRALAVDVPPGGAQHRWQAPVGHAAGHARWLWALA